MYSKHHLISYTPDELLEYIATKLRANGNYHIGETLRGSVDEVWDGKLIAPDVKLPVISFDRPIAHIPPNKLRVTTISRTYPLSTIDSHLAAKLSLPSSAKWIYPYKAQIPHAPWLSLYNPGDQVAVTDDSMQTTPHTLTEQDFLDHEYVIFSFAASS